MLRSTVRGQVSQQHRPMLQLFTCENDLSIEPPNAPPLEAVASGAESFFVVGAKASG
jgi:hypothetical protein